MPRRNSVRVKFKETKAVSWLVRREAWSNTRSLARTSSKDDSFSFRAICGHDYDIGDLMPSAAAAAATAAVAVAVAGTPACVTRRTRRNAQYRYFIACRSSRRDFSGERGLSDYLIVLALNDDTRIESCAFVISHSARHCAAAHMMYFGVRERRGIWLSESLLRDLKREKERKGRTGWARWEKRERKTEEPRAMVSWCHSDGLVSYAALKAAMMPSFISPPLLYCSSIYVHLAGYLRFLLARISHSSIRPRGT